jgi:hypothetical protein
MRLASSFVRSSFFLVLPVLVLTTLGACGEQVKVEHDNTGGGATGSTVSMGPDLGTPCTCPADAGSNICMSCGAGLECFAPSMHSGVCTRTCTPTTDGGSDCPGAFACERSALDDYATGPWCL